MPSIEREKRLGVYRNLIKTGNAFCDKYRYSDDRLRHHLKKLCKKQLLSYKVEGRFFIYRIKNKPEFINFLERNTLVEGSHVEKILHLLKSEIEES